MAEVILVQFAEEIIFRVLSATNSYEKCPTTANFPPFRFKQIIQTNNYSFSSSNVGNPFGDQHGDRGLFKDFQAPSQPFSRPIVEFPLYCTACDTIG